MKKFINWFLDWRLEAHTKKTIRKIKDEPSLGFLVKPFIVLVAIFGFIVMVVGLITKN
jgi:hypothetical protein